jgi:hypothetical protein
MGYYDEGDKNTPWGLYIGLILYLAFLAWIAFFH